MFAYRAEYVLAVTIVGKEDAVEDSHCARYERQVLQLAADESLLGITTKFDTLFAVQNHGRRCSCGSGRCEAVGWGVGLGRAFFAYARTPSTLCGETWQRRGRGRGGRAAYGRIAGRPGLS